MKGNREKVFIKYLKIQNELMEFSEKNIEKPTDRLSENNFSEQNLRR